MKRFLVVLGVIIITGITLFFLYFRSSSGYKSIYLVPDNATLILESKDPLGAWENIVHSNAWQHLKTNAAISELNEDIEYFDSLITSNRFYMRLLGKKQVLVSQHYTSQHKYDYLYVLELGKAGKIKNPERILKSVLGDGFEVTTRTYSDQKIVELLDLSLGDYLFMSFYKGKLLLSADAKLLEASIDAGEDNMYRNNAYFLDVYSKIRAKGLFSLYINHEQFDQYVNFVAEREGKKFKLANHVKFTGLSFNLSPEGLISLESFSSSDIDDNESILSLLHPGKIDLESAAVIPERLASLAKISFTDAAGFFESSINTLKEDDQVSYRENLEKMEKRFKISLEENFFSWMKDEIVLLQTQPSNLGRDNEFAVLFHAKDSALARENISYVWRQIKRNSPVKIKSVKYKTYTIDYVAFPGFLKLLFGQMLEKIEKPYFTQIGDNVIISNHPQTLKNIIDDYLSGTTLATSVSYYNFNKNFNDKSSLYMYFEPPVLFHNLKGLLTYEGWQKVSKNKSHITCFRQGGLQINLVDDLIHVQLKAQYQPELVGWKKQYYNSYEILNMFTTVNETSEEELPKEQLDTVPFIIINSLDASKQEDPYPSGNIKWVVELKNGLKDGDFKAWYDNGEVWIKGFFKDDKPSGKWKYYNEEGELIKTDKY